VGLCGRESPRVGIENPNFEKLYGFELLTFSYRIALFFKTGMDNPPSNFTWRKILLIPIEWYQEQIFSMLCEPVNTAQNIKTATDWSIPKDGDSLEKFNLFDIIR
jgi:hypothetical protein